MATLYLERIARRPFPNNGRGREYILFIVEMESPSAGRNPGAGEGEPLPAAASSLEDKCPICLDEYCDKAFITVCFHILSCARLAVI